MSGGRFVTDDGCSLAYEACGSGVPVLWQHGLGADRRQPAEVFPELAGFRRITLECRGHGDSGLGDSEWLSISQFADDAVALLDHLNIGRAIVGGISLGAAISLRLAAIVPARVQGLVLARPAWLSEPAPATMRPYLLIAELLRTYGAEDGRRRSYQAQLFKEVEAISPDNAASLQGFFSREGEQSTVELLSRIPNDGPGVTKDQIAALRVPTIVIGNGEEYVHPLRYAQELSRLIPSSTLKVICSKTVDASLYRSQFRAAMLSFLERDWGT